MNPLLYVDGVRAARPRQLRARALRPLARRRFPASDPPRLPQPVPAAAELWRSEAFAPADPPPSGTRLAGFHENYGEDVLAAARAGDATGAGALVARWIESNPPRDDDAWHPYVVATRIANWTAALTLLPELADKRLGESLWRQLLRLEVNLEDDVLGNHLIRDARGLVAGGAAFGEARFTEAGLELLARELPEQILADGGHYERSPVYHLVVLRDLLEIEATTGRSPEPIARMRTFAAALQRPDGAPALFNDGGLDLAPRLVLPDPPEGLTVLAETGYAVVRTPRLWLAFDCGPPAPAFLPAHAHADALSLQLWWDGRPAIVDSGTSTYEAGPERDRLRSTRAHSTVAIDDGSQFETWRAFRTGPLPRVRFDGAGEASLEAHVDWPGGVTHHRRVEWSDDEVVVSDRLVGAGRHRAESRLVLAPGTASARVEPDEGDEEGWVSERFGERTPTSVKVVSREGKLPLELEWRVRPLS
jgi:uncharacterized heparinase superfamily protein